MEPNSRPGSNPNGTLRPPQALLLMLRTVLAGPTSRQVTQTDNWQDIKETDYRLIELFNPFATSGGGWLTSLSVGMVKLTALCGIGSVIWLWRKQNMKGDPADAQSLAESVADNEDDVTASDPALFKKHSTIESYTVPSTGITYPRLRTFYRPHPQADQFPKEPRPIPLLVFIHGLGGSIAQFSPILLSLTSVASCLAVDLPGCGLSTFEPTAWGAYTTEALVQLLAVVIETHRNVKEGQSVILVGHSMGCSLAALLASPSSPYAHLISNHVDGLVAICPQAEPPTEKQVKALRGATSIPAIFFDIFRKWDRRGGVNSKSVLRMTGAGADEETKRLQLRYNKQSRTSAWQRIARGMCPDYSSGSPRGGLRGKDVWAGLKIPVFLAAGEADQVTPASNVKRIAEFLGRDISTILPPSEKASLPIAAAPFDPARVHPSKDLPAREHQDSGVDAGDLPTSDNDGKTMETTSVTTADGSLATTEDVSTEGSVTTAEGPLVSDSTTPSSPHPTPYPRRLVVKTLILPSPAAHSLLFAPSSSRILAGLISNFFKDHIDPRLYLAWQLSHLSVEGKWDVKNLEKWEKVPPVSAPIANVFRAMKTLREVDKVHTPKVLVKQLHGHLSAVIDISHDNPVYNPKGLEDGGIPYHKFPTVSKHPPPPSEVKQFIELVNKIRAEGRQGLVGVHCHYGFNRTGFFLVCYLVEEEGWRVEDAIHAFQTARPPGIRHSHFIDALHVRYAVGGLRRAPTL